MDLNYSYELAMCRSLLKLLLMTAINVFRPIKWEMHSIDTQKERKKGTIFVFSATFFA